MMNNFKNKHGINIIGQGGKFILFMLPYLISAILANNYFPKIASLPKSISFFKPAGYIVLIPGFLLSGVAITKLLAGFLKGKLVISGAYLQCVENALV